FVAFVAGEPLDDVEDGRVEDGRIPVGDGSPARAPKGSGHFAAFTGCIARRLMARRVQVLMAPISRVSLTISSSENWLRTVSKASSGACVSAIRVSASVQASAARSRSL